MRNWKAGPGTAATSHTFIYQATHHLVEPEGLEWKQAAGGGSYVKVQERVF